jgi:glycosyltransferase involved in cell wall biosynthesis
MYEFEMKGVYYHFYKSDLPILHTKLPQKFNKIIKYHKNRSGVKKFVKRIKPDIVNLIGTENPYYSITVLDIKSIPVFVSVQTVYTDPEIKKMIDHFDQFRFDIELKIHQKEKYYGCTGRKYRDLILANNPDALIFKHFFPIQKPGKLEEVSTEYDFVFFAATVTSVKGIEDALEALSIVKKEIDNVTLNVVGNCSPDYLNMIKEKINGLGLNENVSFNDYFLEHADMFQHIKKSRFALLPIKLDVIPGTVIEAMLLGLPLVTYRTTGTPYLNKDGETVLLADIGDTGKLAENMLNLLNSPELANKLRKVAKDFAEKEFDNTTSAKRLLSNYRAVMEHYYHNTPISERQMFDPNEFPLY